ncbi:MAG: ATP-binding protein [Planctomycetes bacterium]|nr:ATP-binding protein [Planctomycetota bacterium]MCH9727347.1 ATP-binding protein [Planctomycetota bacterium]MCH9776993.1 ATP-binding protein [Planctomycetota bacterium]MCH9791893.1 ATP-binding protein [Planctomycetota bacterium]
MTDQPYEKLGAFYLGREYDLPNREIKDDLVLYDSKDLTTHAVCVGMTGSGKTGLCLSLLEEAAIDDIPVIAIDPKGDLGNLLLNFPDLKPTDFRPWIEESEAVRKGKTPDEYASWTADLWKKGLADWQQDGARIERLRSAVDMAIYTPGSNAGLPISVLKSFDAPSDAVLNDSDALRDRIMSAVSGLLALLKIDADPINSREHILLSNILSNAWKEKRNLSIASLIQEIQVPPIDKVGFLDLETFYPSKERMQLSMQLNNLLASPGFESWMQGEALNIGNLLMTKAGKPRISILSIAHLSESERMFFVTVLLNEVLAWVRSQSGTSSLRAILYMDEVYGYFPPTANPPSKTPMLTLLKQARAFGLGVVLSTQNPVDLDYKGLSNTGTWFIGRLQTERDKARLLDGLKSASGTAGSQFDRQQMEATLSDLGSRVFLLHNVHEETPVVFHTRWALSYLRGPLTRTQIKELMQPRKDSIAEITAGTAPAPTVTTSPESDPTQRPLIPSEIRQRIFTASNLLAQGSRLVYRVGLIGLAKLRYADAKSKVDLWQDVALLTTITGELPESIWEEATSIPTGNLEYENEPAEQAQFAEVDSALTKKKQYQSWEKNLKTYLYQERPLNLWFSADPKLYSDPNENEAAFRARLKQLMREKRDLQMEKLRTKYASKFETIKNRIRTAEERVAREESQYSDKKLSTFLSLGTTIFGALMGRKVASATNMRKASTAARNVGRAAKEHDDIGRAKEALEVQKQKFADLEDEFQKEIDKLEEPIHPEDFEIDEYPVRPRKSDLMVNEVAFVWLPWSVDATGISQPLYRLDEE